MTTLTVTATQNTDRAFSTASKSFTSYHDAVACYEDAVDFHASTGSEGVLLSLTVQGHGVGRWDTGQLLDITLRTWTSS